MRRAEARLRTINAEGHWHAPSLKELDYALDGLSQSMAKLIGTEYWRGAAADAASRRFEAMVKSYAKIRIAIGKAERAIDLANDALTHAASKINHLPSSLIPASAYEAVDAAKAAGHAAVKPLPGFAEVPLDGAIDAIAGLLGGNRDKAAQDVLDELSAELREAARLLVGLQDDLRFDRIDPGPIPVPEPIPDPQHGQTGGTGGIGGGGGGRYLPPSPNPVVYVPPPPYNPHDPDLHGTGDDRDGGDLSADDGSGGYLPGSYGGDGYGGGYGGGHGGGLGHGALAAGVLGGATAAGAAALRLGIGSGGSGAAAQATAGVGARGGLLSGTGSGAANAGGASSAAGGRGANGGLMGQGGMGGAGANNKKDKKPGLGGPIAPKLVDDEPDFTPLGDGARAGGRDQ